MQIPSEALFSYGWLDFQISLYLALIATFSNVSSPIAQALVHHGSKVLQQKCSTEEDNRNVYRDGHSLCRNGNKMPSLRGNTLLQITILEGRGSMT
jgi:hypothetical protein